MKKLYSTKEAAKFIGINRKTLQRWRKAGVLVPDSFGENNAVFYTESQLVKVATSIFSTKRVSCDIQGCNVAALTNCVPTLTNYVPTQAEAGNETVQRVTSLSQTAQCEDSTGAKVNLPAVIETPTVLPVDSETEVTYEVKEEDLEFEFDDLEVISFENFLPEMHRRNITKLFGKLIEAPFDEPFATPFNGEKTIINYAKLDYGNCGITFDRKFDVTDELIMDAIYSFQRAEIVLFTSRNILQHLFGNVPDHFQFELVEIIEQHLDKLKYMRFSMDLKDKFGNNTYIKIHGEKYRPVELEESLLDVSILKMKSAKNSKIIKVYRINRLSPIFKYAEKLKQITSWATELMKVPVRKTIQNALLCNYLLMKISLVKNSKNKYKNNGILFKTIHEDLNLDVDSRNKIKNIRDTIRKMFEYWLIVGLIKSYLFEKKGTSFYKISFTVE